MYIYHAMYQQEVAAGSKINIAGFGTFKRTDRQARKGRNPKTGEELDIPAKKAPTFTALTAFKSKVNGDDWNIIQQLVVTNKYYLATMFTYDWLGRG